mmetsp:Transcript_13799/g.38124  ORF Transcript_13799/g.38124 Transcript_13799/m.38124 type:complete len:1147 (-) Transcript_13799:72-3512(-)
MSLLGGSGSLTGDIWSTGAFSFESPLKDLLDTNNYTLEQLLAEDELLQEVRGLHPILIDYFSQEQNLTKLIRYITLPHQTNTTTRTTATTTTSSVEEKGDNGSAPLNGAPSETGAQRVTRQLEKRKSGEKTTSPEEDPEFLHVRFPYMACEIVCCEVDGIINTLVDGFVKDDDDDKTENNNGEIVTSEQDGDVEVVDRTPLRLLDLFFNVLYDTPAGQLDDYRAGYFDKILSILFRKRSQELSDYINEGGSRGQQSLMEAMMKHLYSHSIMQICQRLLLPPRPTPKQTEEGEEGGETPSHVDGDEEGVGGGQDILSGEEDDEEDPNGIAIKCDWSKSGIAIEMLLQRLINPETLLEADAQISPVSAVDSNQSIEEQRLSLSLNASDVLITVIQNSLLSSETMLSLTSTATLERLSAAATKLLPGESFSPHESLLTSAMNVVESLILQLGGYGAVGTMAILEPSDDPGEAVEAEGGGPPPPSDAENDHLIADLESLLEVLPTMLKGYSDLLRHPSTNEWKSAVQFSKDEPVQLLGTSRLRIVRVLESLVLLGDPSIDSKLVQSDCLMICLDLFWEFQWCSMLHQSVANLLVHVFEGQNARFEIQEYFISKCNLIRRLMDSFVEVTDPRVHNVVMDIDNVMDGEETKIAEGKDDGADALPVSEDDIDAAIETQEDEEAKAPDADNVDLVSTEAVDQESRDASTVGITAPAQSFRFGYMGHVIIICQALVQACANEWAAEQDADMTSQQQSEGGTSELQSVSDVPGDSTNQTGSAYPPLLIAELVNNHELAERWQEFVISTLASEIAVQSTPLGGLNAQPSDPLQAHRPDGLGRRPGLADDGDIGDDAMAPPPPRGMMGSDENLLSADELGLAASVMARLNLNGRPLDDERSGGSEGEFSGSGDSGDSQRSYNSGETNNSREGYLFDDPLGKAGGSLGIELGKLTQYSPRDGERTADDDDDGSSNASSSDEEPPREDDDDEGADPPVMDLFAGNFNHPAASPGDQKPDTSDGPAEGFDFANFDAAFDGDAAAGAFGDFESAPDSVAEPNTTPSNGADDIFGGTGSGSLLDKLDEFPPPPNGENADPEKEAEPADDGAEKSPDENVADEDPANDKEETPEGEEEPVKAAEEAIATPPTEENPQKEGVLVS